MNKEQIDNLFELRVILSEYKQGRDITEALEQLILAMQSH